MNQDPHVLGRVDLMRLFPNLQILLAPIVALRTRIIGCLMIFWVLSGLLEFESTASTPPHPGALLPVAILSAPVVDGIETIRVNVTSLLNLAPHSLKHLPQLVIQLFCLLLSATAIGRFTGNRIFRGESCSMLQCLRQAVRSWQSLLQALAIWAALLVLCRLSLWLALTSASLFHLSSIIAPAATLAFILTVVIVTVAAGLACTAIGYDECSGAEGVSRGLSYVLSRPGVATLMLACTLVFSRLLSFGAVSLLILYGTEFADPSNTWKSGILLDSLSLAVCISGLTITYVRLREEVDGVPENEVSR